MSVNGGGSAQPLEIGVLDDVRDDLQTRLAAARWPEQPSDHGWDLGADLIYARELCDHWRDGYDFDGLARLNGLGSQRWEGMHFLRAGDSDGLPVVLLHGWPSGPIEYEPAARLLAEAGYDAIVPSLPGYAWSEAPQEPLNVAGISERLRALLSEGLGLDRYAVAGGDWGAIIAGRIAYDAPDRVAGLYLSTPSTLPRAAELGDPPMTEAEGEYVKQGLDWLRRKGHHMAIQGTAPDVVSPALSDSPAGLTAYLIEKYKRWADCGEDIESRFSKDDLCDFLTMFWATGAIAPSMRLYWAEARDRWRLQPGETIDVPAAASIWAAEIVNPPREWTARVLTDLRRWTEMPSGGHFAAFEEPEAYASDLGEFLGALD